MKWSYQIGSIEGIPIKLHVTFLIIFLFVLWLFAANNFAILGITIGFGGMDISTGLKYLLGAIAAALFFTTLLFHELSHSFVAQRYGAQIRGITLFVIGGVSQMDEIPKEPRMETRISAAGPGLSLGIGVFTYTIYYLFGPVDLAGTGAVFKNATLILVGIIAFYNILLGLFNLIPAFPMDGGRLLRAWLAKRMPYIDATRRAVAVGKSFAFAMGIFGLLTIASGGSGGLWLLLIALFIYFGGSEEERATVVSVTLEGVKVRDLMTPFPNVIYVPPDWTLDQLIDVMFKTKHMGYPVQERLDSPVLGMITFADIQKIPASKRSATKIEDVMTRELIAIRPDTVAYDALKLMSTRNVGRLLVMENGEVKGIVSRTDLVRAIQFRGMYK